MAQATVIFNELEKEVIARADAQIKAEGFTKEALEQLLDGNDVTSEEASAIVKTLNEKIRTFNGEIVAVDSLRKSKEAPRILAVRRYDTISKAWLALRAEAKGTTTKKKQGAKIEILSTAKQFSGFAKAQIAALRKREKADFPLSEMVAAWVQIQKIAETKK